MMRLNKKVAIVTGATKGIGASIAELFASEGAIVCFFASTKEDGIKKQEQFHAAGYETTFYCVDITDRAVVSKTYKAVMEKYGKLDIVVNNAGYMVMHGMADEITAENERIARRMFDVNVFGMNNCASESIQYFRKNGGGSIVNISSLSAYFAYEGDWAYIASKAAVIGLTRSYAISYAKDNIRCNCVLPSVVLTEGALKTTGQTMETATDLPNPMRKFIKPRDIAQAVLFFASDESSLITGRELAVDGGLTTSFPNPIL
jgi:3-oxoacyl-[acyl-carrier protein] reductase